MIENLIRDPHLLSQLQPVELKELLKSSPSAEVDRLIDEVALRCLSPWSEAAERLLEMVPAKVIATRRFAVLKEKIAQLAEEDYQGVGQKLLVSLLKNTALMRDYICEYAQKLDVDSFWENLFAVLDSAYEYKNIKTAQWVTDEILARDVARTRGFTLFSRLCAVDADIQILKKVLFQYRYSPFANSASILRRCNERAVISFIKDSRRWHEYLMLAEQYEANPFKPTLKYPLCFPVFDKVEYYERFWAQLDSHQKQEALHSWRSDLHRRNLHRMDIPDIPAEEYYKIMLFLRRCAEHTGKVDRIYRTRGYNTRNPALQPVLGH